MAEGTLRRSILAAVAALALGAGLPVQAAPSAGERGVHATEQTGMSWVEYFQCVVHVKDDLGSWAAAADLCSGPPTDIPDPPVRTEGRRPSKAEPIKAQ